MKHFTKLSLFFLIAFLVIVFLLKGVVIIIEIRFVLNKSVVK